MATRDDEYSVPMGAFVAAGQLSARATAKLAVTVIGPLIVTVVDALVALATGPDQPLNANPEFGVA